MNRLYAGMFYQKEVSDIFSDRSLLHCLLRTEAALAKSQAMAGVIPQAAALTIERVCTSHALDKFDVESLILAGGTAGNVAIPFVKQLTAIVREIDEDAARYVHWGATSQDVLDTACILQCRDALNIIESQLELAYDTALMQAHTYRNQIMIGRTWLQQALPITFGYKVARWAAAFKRDLTRIEGIKARVLTAQLGGAVGSLASLQDQGSTVVTAFARQLNLSAPICSWHGERDRIVEIASVLGLIVGSLGKMARDWSLMMQTEVAELLEPSGTGRGGSSTMPHKRNPVAAAAVLAAANRVPVLLASLYAAMVQEHERGLGSWQAEWLSLPEIFQLCSGALARTIDVLEGMQVNADAMQGNMECTNGLIMAEAVMMRLAPKIGRLNAHHLVQTACRQAVEQGLHLKAVIGGMDQIKQQFNTAQLEDMFDPATYMGNIEDQINAVLGQDRTRNEE